MLECFAHFPRVQVPGAYRAVVNPTSLRHPIDINSLESALRLRGVECAPVRRHKEETRILPWPSLDPHEFFAGRDVVNDDGPVGPVAGNDAFTVGRKADPCQVSWGFPMNQLPHEPFGNG